MPDKPRTIKEDDSRLVRHSRDVIDTSLALLKKTAHLIRPPYRAAKPEEQGIGLDLRGQADTTNLRPD